MEYGGQKILQRFGGVPCLAMQKKKKWSPGVQKNLVALLLLPSLLFEPLFALVEMASQPA